MVEHSSHNWHDHDVVRERPKEVYLDEHIPSFNEPYQSQDLVKAFRKNNHIGRIDVELGFGIDADADSRLLQTGNVVEPVANHNHVLLAALLHSLNPRHLREGTLFGVQALVWYF
jgi:hypothetical protein